MSDDIVDWLRAEAKYCREECLTPDEETADKLDESANEIVRLRAAATTAAAIIDKHLYPQREKVKDASAILRAVLQRNS